MPSILIVGATRGLDASLAKRYASSDMDPSQANTVYGTTRSDSAPLDCDKGQYLGLGTEECQFRTGVSPPSEPSRWPAMIYIYMNRHKKIIAAGHFATEDFSKDNGPHWSEQQRMYTTSSIAPVFIAHRLVHTRLLQKGSKVVLVSSEAGSIGLRHEKEGGGNYAHHASKAALNMVGKLLSLDLKERGIAVGIVHPGFMRTEMTRGVGYDESWDEGGAVTPDEAARSLVDWVNGLDMNMTGEFWAPRGPGDIGTAEATVGQNLPTPLQLPW
ncbi:hypothetical protein E4U59_007646 [Claviceps monticola]|nr:hypothetical protein E4U59_007646 [Claviceps monticola]